MTFQGYFQIIIFSSVMIRLNWSLPCVHTTKLVSCKYANIFFFLSVDIKKFCWNIKGLEVLGQIQLSNAWEKYFPWKNYLGQSTGNSLGSNYVEVNRPGVIVQGTIISAPIVRGNFCGGHCLGGNYPGGNYLGSNYPGGNCPGGAIGRGAIIQGAIVLEPIKHQIIFDLSKVLLKKYSRKLNETILVNNLGANMICSEHVTDNQSKYSK